MDQTTVIEPTTPPAATASETSSTDWTPPTVPSTVQPQPMSELSSAAEISSSTTATPEPAITNPSTPPINIDNTPTFVDQTEVNSNPNSRMIAMATTEPAEKVLPFDQAVEQNMKQETAFNDALKKINDGVSPDKIDVKNDPSQRNLSEVVRQYYGILTIKAESEEAASDVLVLAQEKLLRGVLKAEFGKDYDHLVSELVVARAEYLQNQAALSKAA